MIPAPVKKLSAPEGDAHALEVHRPPVERESKKEVIWSRGEMSENLSAEITSTGTMTSRVANSIGAGIEMSDAILLEVVRGGDDLRLAHRERRERIKQCAIGRAITSAAGVVAVVRLHTLDASTTGQKKLTGRTKRSRNRLPS